jgi:hypothetical protein
MRRRNVLRGAFGAVMALPFLEGLAPRTRARAAAAPFAVFVRQGNGVAQEVNDEPERYWPTQGPGSISVASLSGDSDRALSELGAFADRLAIVRGINFAFPGNGCGHSGGGNQCLTAARVSDSPSGNESLSMGESIDNLIARQLTPDIEPLTLYAGRKLGYLDEVLSYRDALQIRGAERDPYAVYMDLFGLAGVGEEELEKLRLRRKSVNDLVREEMVALRSRSDLSSTDRVRLEQHFDAIRDLEENLSCELSDEEVLDLNAVTGVLDDDTQIETVLQRHYDLLTIAVACGVRRSATLQIGCGNDQTQYVVDDVQQLSFHKISHRINSDGDTGDPIPNADMLHHKIDRILLRSFRYFLERLDAAGVLDDGVVCMTNDLSNKWHSYQNVPYILAGSAGGFLKTGLYVDAGGIANNKILNTIGAAVGCTNASGGLLDDFGDPSLEPGLVDSIVA